MTPMELRAEYEAGATVCQLAQRHNCTWYCVNQRLHDAGTIIRPRGGGKRIADPRWAEAKRLYDSGLNLERVAERMGRSVKTIATWTLKAGRVMEERHRIHAEQTDRPMDEQRVFGLLIWSVQTCQRHGMRFDSAEWMRFLDAFRDSLPWFLAKVRATDNGVRLEVGA